MLLPRGGTSASNAANFVNVWSRAVPSIPLSPRYSYLDTAGRPVLVVRATNLVDDISGDFLVHYRMAPLAAVREPTLLIGTLALLFAGIVAWLRLDLSLSRGAGWVAGQKRAAASAALQRILLVVNGEPALLLKLTHWCTWSQQWFIADGLSIAEH